jgi:hypothetical protein
MRQAWSILGWLPLLWLTACVAPHPEASTTMRTAALTQGVERPALDRRLTRGDIHVVEVHLQAFGFDSGQIWPPGLGPARLDDPPSAEP